MDQDQDVYTITCAKCRKTQDIPYDDNISLVESEKILRNVYGWGYSQDAWYCPECYNSLFHPPTLSAPPPRKHWVSPYEYMTDDTQVHIGNKVQMPLGKMWIKIKNGYWVVKRWQWLPNWAADLPFMTKRIQKANPIVKGIKHE